MYNCTFTQMLLPCPLYLMQGFPRTRSQSLGRSTPLQVAAGCAPDSRLCFSSSGISHCICQCLCICICLCSRLRSSLCFSSSGRSLVRFPDWVGEPDCDLAAHAVQAVSLCLSVRRPRLPGKERDTCFAKKYSSSSVGEQTLKLGEPVK